MRWYEDEYVRLPLRPRMRVKRQTGFADGGVVYELKSSGDDASATLAIGHGPSVASAFLEKHSAPITQDHPFCTTRAVETHLSINRPEWRETAYETVIKRNGEVRYGWLLTLQLNNSTVALNISGAGDHVRGEQIWRELVEKLVVKQRLDLYGATDRIAAKGTGTSRGSNSAGKAPRKKKAGSPLLPSSISYLSTTVDELSRQRRSALDSGDSDLSSLSVALNQKYAKIEGPERAQCLTADAHELETWADALPPGARNTAHAAFHITGVLKFMAESVQHGQL